MSAGRLGSKHLVLFVLTGLAASGCALPEGTLPDGSSSSGGSSGGHGSSGSSGGWSSGSSSSGSSSSGGSSSGASSSSSGGGSSGSSSSGSSSSGSSSSSSGASSSGASSSGSSSSSSSGSSSSSSGGSSGASTPVALHGKLSVQGNRIVDEHGAVVQLRGMSFGWSQWWGQYWTPQTVSWLVDDWKVQLVRAAMGVEMEGYLASPSAEKAKLMAVVDEAIRRGIYVIVDWHDHNAPDHVDSAKAFFSEMAVTYGHYPNVIWEIFNEPDNVGPGGVGSDSWDVIKAYAGQVIPAIRAKDPDNLIIVGTPEWSQRVDQASQSPISGTNIAYTLHFYAATHKQYLRDYASQALARGVALFVTEWGTCEATGTGYLDAAETDTWLRFLDDNALSSANWDIADKEGETCSSLLPSRSTTGGWSASDLTASGRLVRGKLRTYAGAGP